MIIIENRVYSFALYTIILLCTPVSHARLLATHISFPQRPIIVHHDQTSHSLSAYQVQNQKAQMQISLLWQINVSSSASNPIIIGKPDRHYQDKWPWPRGGDMPGENSIGAQSYSQFRQTQANRNPILYQVDERSVLTAYSLTSGEVLLSMSLTDWMPINNQDCLNEDITPAQLYSMDVFFDLTWHTILLVACGSGRNTLLCFDMTYAHLSTHQSVNMLWIKHDIEATFSHPIVARVSAIGWIILVAQTSQQTLNQCNRLLMLDVKQGSEYYQVELPSQKSETFDALTAIDSKRMGSIDCVYVAMSHGAIWKIDMPYKQPLSLVPKPLFTSGGGVNQYRVSEPSVLSHPDGGKLVCFYLHDKTVRRQLLISLVDHSNHHYSLSELTQAQNKVQDSWYVLLSGEWLNSDDLSRPNIRSQRVVSVTSEQVIVRQAHTGDVVSTKPLLRLNNSNLNTTTMIGAPLLLHDMINDKIVLLQALSDNDFAWAELDFEKDKLGRRVWRTG